jgi:hypothetical protein
MADGPHPRVDREQAFQYWASLPHDNRTYAAVAQQFGVSPRTVERYARDGRWSERLQRIRDEAADRADRKLGRDLASQLADFHQLIEASCVTYARQLAGGEVRISAAEFVGLIRVALLLQGGPTVRIDAVSDSAEWARLRDRILRALEPYPEARLALAGALETDNEEIDGERARG